MNRDIKPDKSIVLSSCGHSIVRNKIIKAIGDEPRHPPLIREFYLRSNYGMELDGFRRNSVESDPF